MTNTIIPMIWRYLSASRCARLLSETESLPCSRPGLLVVPESIRECGKVIEKRRDIFEADKIYYCHTYVYFCDVKDEHVAAQMTDSEIRLEYHLSWATPDEIIKANSAFLDKEWIARDTKIVELIKEMC